MDQKRVLLQTTSMVGWEKLWWLYWSSLHFMLDAHCRLSPPCPSFFNAKQAMPTTQQERCIFHQPKPTSFHYCILHSSDPLHTNIVASKKAMDSDSSSDDEFATAGSVTRRKLLESFYGQSPDGADPTSSDGD